MKKPITYLITTQVLILVSVASLLFSSCIIVHPDDDYDVYVEKKAVKQATSKETDETNSSDDESRQTAKYSITVKNATSTPVINWCVKNDNKVTLSSSGFTGSIRENGGEDKISDLPEGYYKIYFTFDDGDSIVESITLDQDVTFYLSEKHNSYVAECRALK